MPPPSPRTSPRRGSGDTGGASELISAARKELANTHPESFKILCLALFAGLRRREIDLLEWTSFQWESGELRLQPTQYFSPKSEDSIGTIPLESELVALFRGYHAKSRGSFVIESKHRPRNNTTFSYYRCEQHCEFLTNWLRKHGVISLKPLHTLRKEYGSQLCTRAGIFAASRGLRHADIGITSEYYTDSKARAVTGLGHLLSDEQKIISMPVPAGKMRKHSKLSRRSN